MTELIVISGKGGTGKTSIVASFAALAGSMALADCDVDAANLHLVVNPSVLRREAFSGGYLATVLADKCTACGKCEELCRFDAVSFDGPSGEMADKTYRIDPIACEGCGVCAYFCEHDAIDFSLAVNGQWFVSDTRYGPMVHARLGVGESNSGKLVSLVRSQAKKIAEQQGLDLILVDGPPGIGCPVIASVTGADVVLVVAEPSLSGFHDLKRAADLTRHFGIKTLLCVNKWDLNEDLAAAMEQWALRHSLQVAGRVRYDSAVTKAQVRRRPMVECSTTGVGKDIVDLWIAVCTAAELPRSVVDRKAVTAP